MGCLAPHGVKERLGLTVADLSDWTAGDVTPQSEVAGTGVLG